MQREKAVDHNPIEPETPTDSLEIQTGKIYVHEYLPPVDAVYHEDKNGRIVAYVTFAPYMGNEDIVVIESFTNESFRRKGLQKSLNEKLIETLHQKGVKAIVGEIQLDNTASLLNRTSVKNPNGSGVMKAEIVNDELINKIIDDQHPIKPFTIGISVSLTESVPDNKEVIDKLRRAQNLLENNRDNLFLDSRN